MTKTITDTTNPVTAALFSMLGGKFRIRLTGGTCNQPGRSGEVLDEYGRVIGDAHDWPYGMSGFAIHTRPFAGFVPNDNVEFV